LSTIFSISAQISASIFNVSVEISSIIIEMVALQLILIVMDDFLSKWAVDEAIGGAWLALRYGVDPVQPLRMVSRIASGRSRTRRGNRWEMNYEERYRPAPTFRGHLEFMLRHERVNLEFLARLFAVAGFEELSDWSRDEPTGRYSRRAGFFYEWLTGRALEFGGVTNGGYVDALDPKLYFTATKGTNVPRWRVRDNLPGDQSFCPVVLLTDAVDEALSFDISGAWKRLESEFGVELLERSAVWLTVKESRASFAIEGEARQTDRIQRFATVLQTEVGRHDDVFSVESLLHLQQAILGDVTTRQGIRRSPIFVGESRGGLEIVHYVAPHWDLARQMLRGLARLERSTRGRSALLRAAALSFGFVYVHPLTDGNGRISRFLINDVLRRDAALPEPFVLPVSAVISRGMRGYDRTLEIFSKPLMRHYAKGYRFGESVRYEDGFTSTFHFDAYDDAEPAWRYPDLTDHVEYLGEVVRTTVDVEMREEARQMRAYRSARLAVNDIIEGPTEDLDRIVRSVRENDWAISNKLLKEFPRLGDEDVATRIVEAVRLVFDRN